MLIYLMPVRLLCLAISLSVLTFSTVLGKSPHTERNRPIIVDERLAVLRTEPNFSSNLIRRLGRGRKVNVVKRRTASDGTVFCRIIVTRRTGGWIQCASLVSPSIKNDDARLVNLIKEAEGFERIVRAKIFLDQFIASPYRVEVLSLAAEAAEKAAVELTRDAARKFRRENYSFTNAPEPSYYLNYGGLDRYRRCGIVFGFDRQAKRFYYAGENWREILRRYPRSPEAMLARQRLDSQAVFTKP